MRLNKLVALGLVAGLVVGGVTAADAKKKKRKKKKPALVAVDQAYFLRWDGTEDECGDNYLSIVDGEDLGNGCEFTQQPIQEVHAAMDAPLTRDWGAVDGLPFKLDATKPIVGEINIFELFSVNGKLDVVLTGTTGEETVELGTASVDVENTPLDVAVVKFEITPGKELNKKKFTSFNMNLTQRGVALSYMETEDPPSTVTIPTLVRKK